MKIKAKGIRRCGILLQKLEWIEAKFTYLSPVEQKWLTDSQRSVRELIAVLRYETIGEKLPVGAEETIGEISGRVDRIMSDVEEF